MEQDDYCYKTIHDPIHGSIGLSKVEIELIDTPAFQRQRNLKQLGLSYLVFPGATHTRFSHALGAMHVMSRLVDSINLARRRHSHEQVIDPREKQKLRLAALLHDIGHYPLSHATERVFWRLKREKPADDNIVARSEAKQSESGPLQEMAQTGKLKNVSHEQFGTEVVKRRSDLSCVLRKHGFCPSEIADVFSASSTSNPLYSQLIHSALDADRIDFLLRDSYHTGASYGKVDLDFILSNLQYDDMNRMFAVGYKGIPAFEHYLIARYFMYNIYHHKAAKGFELMACTLYYAMVRCGQAVADYDQLVDKIDTPWFEGFDDTYFWSCLKNWSPEDDYHRDLRQNLLHRLPLRVLFEERRLHLRNEKFDPETHFEYLKKSFIEDNIRVKELLDSCGIESRLLALSDATIDVEDKSPISSYRVAANEDELRELGKVFEDYSFKDLIEVKYSIISQLSQYSQQIRRLFFFDRHNSGIGREDFRRRLCAIRQGNTR